ncbi:MAG: DUF2934 domain-containing protein [Candidatus Thiodiazotropha sp. (ex Lucinoma borealis)]|nr:DUF2934 domain-containing protein [Candidatus Thiodiazotropha sp. (ex Lucinoma borealis)]MCU7839723.1 DUF2934 domain-containing protein [Candidatus Thiodiazotropha sp. (ex Troendleina suluensis)]MCU7948375.1 DUF2934 domain-containing protein [Candidatus Thiodiazotropha sp. (ex Cardiolucina cf. quadrata)]MCU7857753.1 DUF2934 domain-containing protein [Candidatus Thiodiazotropha sp. (ex Lucinoma borealis)]MCU7865306.1 DUF2934 domain-containing protein [Candidatus Thiodiazotropha sp. (ex Lucino
MNKRQEKDPKKTTTQSGAIKKTKARVSKKKVAKKKTVSKKHVNKKAVAKSGTSKPAISPRERYEMIATMAYYRAEQREFEPGHDVKDWLECEGIINNLIKNSL